MLVQFDSNRQAVEAGAPVPLFATCVGGAASVGVVSFRSMASSPPRTLGESRKRYRASAEALDRVWLEELAALSDEDALKRTLSLRLFAAMPNASSEWSGLVEQQALFRRLDPA